MPQTSEGTAPANCYACGTALESVFDDGGGVEQWDNALILDLEGGYGMFFDDLDPTRRDLAAGKLAVGNCQLRVVICHGCAHDLCAKVPWLERLLDPLNSHAHRHGRDWTGHEGWDLPHTSSAAETS